MLVLIVDFLMGVALIARLLTTPEFQVVCQRAKLWLWCLKSICRNGANVETRFGRAKISAGSIAAYFIVQVAVAIMLILLSSWAASMLIIALITPICAIAIFDLRWFWIPDRLSLPLVACGIIDAGARGVLATSVGDSLVGFALFFGIREIYAQLRRRAGLGLGDVKLAAAMGAWLHLDDLMIAIVLSSVFAIAGSITLGLISRNGISGKSRIPLGAYMSLAFLIIVGLSRG